MKRKGFILFKNYDGIVVSYDYCSNLKELLFQYDNVIDDVWDMDGRNKEHYFYLDIVKGKYIPLPKWKDNYKKEKGYNQSMRKVLSTKTF